MRNMRKTKTSIEVQPAPIKVSVFLDPDAHHEAHIEAATRRQSLTRYIASLVYSDLSRIRKNKTRNPK